MAVVVDDHRLGSLDAGEREDGRMERLGVLHHADEVAARGILDQAQIEAHLDLFTIASGSIHRDPPDLPGEDVAIPPELVPPDESGTVA